MSKNVIFLRHFKPKVQKEKPVAEWELDEEGKKSMRRMLAKDIFKGVSKIFTSPEPKAKATADAVSRKYGIPVITIKDIAEVDRSKEGFIEGNYMRIVRSYLSESDKFQYAWENINDVRTRIKKFIESLEKEKGDLLVISHGMFLSITLSRYFNKDPIAFWEELRFGEVLETDYKKLQEVWGND